MPSLERLERALWRVWLGLSQPAGSIQKAFAERISQETSDKLASSSYLTFRSLISVVMAGFQARLFALEGAHFRTEDQYATQRHLEKLVADGKLPSTALVAESNTAHPNVPSQTFASDPLRSIKRRPASETVYQHVSHGLPGSSQAHATTCRCFIDRRLISLSELQRGCHLWRKTGILALQSALVGAGVTRFLALYRRSVEARGILKSRLVTWTQLP